jgi:hypothetical protein
MARLWVPVLPPWKPTRVTVIYILELGFMKIRSLFIIPPLALLLKLDLVAKIMDVQMPNIWNGDGNHLDAIFRCKYNSIWVLEFN